MDTNIPTYFEAGKCTNGGETIRRMRETIVGPILFLGGFMNNNNAERTCFSKEESNQRPLLQQRLIITVGTFHQGI